MYTPPIDAPPCIKAGLKWNHCAEKQFKEQILNHVTLVAEWCGWKFKGRDLVSPDGMRINPTRLRAILWTERQLSGGGTEKRTADVINLFSVKKP